MKIKSKLIASDHLSLKDAEHMFNINLSRALEEINATNHGEVEFGELQMKVSSFGMVSTCRYTFGMIINWMEYEEYKPFDN